VRIKVPVRPLSVRDPPRSAAGNLMMGRFTRMMKIMARMAEHRNGTGKMPERCGVRSRFFRR
jgi:hypothetical protein